MSEVESRLGSGPCVLDGATGTELERRGIVTTLPLWSASALWEHPESVEAIHTDYARAGADFLTANTFRTQRRTLARAGRGDAAASLTARAIELARTGARVATPAPCVLGSAPTLEDCYRPEDVPGTDHLEREHGEHAENLVRGGADAILVETMNTVIEATAATRAARATGLPVIVSFVCWEGARLLSGEHLAEGIEAVAPHGPCAIAVNCLPISNVEPCLEVLAGSGLRFGVYANLGMPNDETGFTRAEDTGPAALADRAVEWIAAGASLVGGCCGTGPDHIQTLALRFRRT